MRIENLQTFGRSGADDANVQEREVEVRDAAAPQLLCELVVTRFQVAGGCDIACPQRPFNRGRQRRNQGLQHHDGNRETLGRPFLVREVVRVVHAERPGSAPERSHDANRAEPLQSPPLVSGERAKRAVRDIDPAGHRERAVCFERADVLPDRGVQGSVGSHAVIVLPLLP